MERYFEKRDFSKTFANLNDFFVKLTKPILMSISSDSLISKIRTDIKKNEFSWSFILLSLCGITPSRKLSVRSLVDLLPNVKEKLEATKGCKELNLPPDLIDELQSKASTALKEWETYKNITITYSKFKISQHKSSTNSMSDDDVISSLAFDELYSNVYTSSIPPNTLSQTMVSFPDTRTIRLFHVPPVCEDIRLAYVRYNQKEERNNELNKYIKLITARDKLFIGHFDWVTTIDESAINTSTGLEAIKEILISKDQLIKILSDEITQLKNGKNKGELKRAIFGNSNIIKQESKEDEEDNIIIEHAIKTLYETVIKKREEKSKEVDTLASCCPDAKYLIEEINELVSDFREALKIITEKRSVGIQDIREKRLSHLSDKEVLEKEKNLILKSERIECIFKALIDEKEETERLITVETLNVESKFCTSEKERTLIDKLKEYEEQVDTVVKTLDCNGFRIGNSIVVRDNIKAVKNDITDSLIKSLPLARGRVEKSLLEKTIDKLKGIDIESKDSFDTFNKCNEAMRIISLGYILSDVFLLIEEEEREEKKIESKEERRKEQEPEEEKEEEEEPPVIRRPKRKANPKKKKSKKQKPAADSDYFDI